MNNFKGKISVIIPAFNEGSYIYNNILVTRKVFEEAGVKYELIVVDDGSSDNTFEEANRAAQKDIIKVIRNEENWGKGYALKYGFQFVSGDVVVFLDADLDLHPAQLDNLFKKMREEKADVVIGSKRHPQTTLNYPLHRKIISSIYAAFLKVFFGLPLKDTQTGLKVYRYEVLEKIFPKILCKSYAFDVEILANAHHMGYKVVECPVVLNFRRPVKWGRIGFKDLYQAGNDTLAIFYRMFILKYYDRDISVTDYLPNISIIIEIDQEEDWLKECISACNGLDYINYEVIILSIISLKKEYKGIRNITTEGLSLGKKWDIGIAHSNGEIIAFLGERCFPTKNWLKMAVRNFVNENVVAVGGPSVTPSTDSFLQQASGSILQSWMVSGTQALRYFPKTRREIKDFPSNNFFVRKKEIEKLGDFNPGYLSGEDTLLCLNLTKGEDKKILYDPDALVCQHRLPLFSSHLYQISIWALHRGFFAKKYPETSLKIIYFLPLFLLLGTLSGFVLSLLYAPFIKYFLSALVFYISCTILTGAKSLNWRMTFIIALGIVTTHFTYGFYFLKGLLSKKINVHVN